MPIGFLGRPRVAHYMETCFARTETFVYDFVRGCKSFEPWCVAKRVENQDQFPAPRLCCTAFRWDRRSFWDLVDRVYYRLFRREDSPFYRALLWIRPSVMHAHFGPAGWEALPFARRLGIPLVTSFYGYDASSLPRQPVWASRLRELFDGGTAFLVEGPAMARRLEALGCPRAKIALMPITINVDDYPYRPRRRADGEPLRILFIGRFVPKKGLPILLKAVALARPQLGACELRIIGGGEAESEMRRMSAALGVQDMVHFLGYQPRAEMVREMDASHMLAAPSMTAPDGDAEGGAPTVLLEAQASGLPLLASDHADIPFVVAAPYREYLAREGCAESLADRLLALRADAERWPLLAEAGRQHVLAQHGPPTFARLELLYESIRRRKSSLFWGGSMDGASLATQSSRVATRTLLAEFGGPLP